MYAGRRVGMVGIRSKHAAIGDHDVLDGLVLRACGGVLDDAEYLFEALNHVACGGMGVGVRECEGW